MPRTPRSNRLYRHGAISINPSARWSGNWHWPVNVTFMPTSSGYEIADGLRRFKGLEREHARLLPFSPGVTSDLLLVDEHVDEIFLKTLRGRVGALFLIDKGKPALGAEELGKMLEISGVGAVVNLGAGPLNLDQTLSGFFTEISHDYTFDDALMHTFRYQGLNPADSMVAVASPDFLLKSRLSTHYEEMVSGVGALSKGTMFDIGESFKARLNMPPSAAPAGAAADFAKALERSSRALRFDQEAQAGTGAAAVGRNLEDAQSGPEVRFADSILYRGTKTEESDRLSSQVVLGIDESYLLQFAFRNQRNGIGFDTEPQPLTAKFKKQTELLIAISTGPGSEADIPEPIQTTIIGPTGDSSPAEFIFVPKKGNENKLLIEIRVFSRLNLLELICLELVISPHEQTRHPTDTPAQRAMQPERFQRYDGQIADAVPPCDLSIDVSRNDDGYILTFADADRCKGIRFSVRSAMGRNDFKRLLGEIRDHWLTVGLDVYNAGLNPKDDQAGAKQLESLAKAGSQLWTLLFETGPVTGAARKLGTALKKDPLPDNARISVKLSESARDFVFPWQLLFDRPIEDGKPINLRGFWGMRYDVSQHVSLAARRPASVKKAKRRRLSMFFDTSITGAPEQDDLICKLAKKAGLEAEGFEARAGLDKRLTAGDDRLLYFFCHGRTGAPFDEWADDLRRVLAGIVKVGGTGNTTVATLVELLSSSNKLDGSETALKLRSDIVQLRSLLGSDHFFSEDPIVFLNMCESAQLYPDSSQSFVRFFLDRFAAAIVGTECPIPRVFGDEMAKLMLPMLLGGTGVGDALLTARRAMLNDYANPLGLAYSLWGDSTASVSSSSGNLQQEKHSAR